MASHMVLEAKAQNNMLKLNFALVEHHQSRQVVVCTASTRTETLIEAYQQLRHMSRGRLHIMCRPASTQVVRREVDWP